MASAAEVSCEGWNTKSFFKRAGAGDVTRCLEAGGDVNGRNEEGETPLHWAAKRNGKRDVMAALLKAGADPNARNEKGSTPLHWAADSGSPAGLTALLKAGADPNARDVWGYTPLHRAAGFSINPALVAALIEAGADPKARNVWDSSPLHWAAKKNGNPAVLAALLKAGADPKARNKRGYTPLRYAAMRKRNRAVAATFLKAWAGTGSRAGKPKPASRKRSTANCVDWNTRAFFQTATVGKMGECLEAGKDLNAWDKDGGTPLHWAARYTEHTAVISALIEAGADPNAWDKDGSTPLHWAAHNNEHLAVISALIEAGAEPDAPNERGLAPFDYASTHNRNPAIAAALLKASRDRKGEAILPRAIVDENPVVAASGFVCIGKRSLERRSECDALHLLRNSRSEEPRHVVFARYARCMERVYKLRPSCGKALTCIDGLVYPTTCGPANCEEPIGKCHEPRRRPHIR